MLLRLDENYRIKSDGLNYTLYKRIKPKDETKKEYWTAQTFNDTLTLALKSYCRITGKEAFKESKDIAELLAKLDEIQNVLERFDIDDTYGFGSIEEADAWMNGKPVGEEEI